MSYRDDLFNKYEHTHIKFLDTNYNSKISWFTNYYKNFYKARLESFSRQTTKILEIGCNRGYLLKVLSDDGFKHLTGIDLSPEAIKSAQENFNDINFYNIDANVYLQDNIEN